MSYLWYIASRRPLPEGLFGIQPFAVYESYAEYAQSPHYFQSKHLPEDVEEGFFRTEGHVHMFKHTTDFMQAIEVTPLNLSANNDPLMLALERAFTLPCKYRITVPCFDYLCKYLKLDNEAELYCYYEGHDAVPVSDQPIIIDLKDASANKLTRKGFRRLLIDKWGSHEKILRRTIRVLPPEKPMLHLAINKAESETQANFMMSMEDKECMWTRELPHRQGVF